MNRRARAFHNLINTDPPDETLVCESRHIGEYPSFAAMTEAYRKAGAGQNLLREAMMNKISFESAGKWMLADFDTPIDMDFWVSGQCNMRCRYCVHSLEKNHAARKNLVPGLLPW